MKRRALARFQVAFEGPPVSRCSSKSSHPGDDAHHPDTGRRKDRFEEHPHLHVRGKRNHLEDVFLTDSNPLGILPLEQPSRFF